MSESGPFAASIDQTTRWLETVATAMGTSDHHRAWTALRAVLQTLRDHITHDEAAQLAAQLPQIIRGGFYEGWRPSDTPKRVHQAEAFLAEIAARMGPRQRDDLELELVHVFQAVVSALTQCGLGPELAQVRGQLPGAVQELWQIAVV